MTIQFKVMKVPRFHFILAVIFCILFSGPLQAQVLDFSAFEEPKVTFDNLTYIMPNERQYFLFQPFVKELDGVAVSVGTFRSLSVASQGNFSHLVMMDMDWRIVQFNKVQIGALKQAENFAEFKKLMAIPKFMEDVMPTSKDLGEYELRWKYVTELERLAQYDEGATFISSPEKYQKLRKMALAGQISSVVGNVASNDMSLLSDELSKHSLKVSVIDISNVPTYLAHSRKMEVLMDSLKKLPLDEKARVNFTVGTGLDAVKLKGQPVSDSWEYLSVKARKYIEGKKFFVGRSELEHKHSGTYNEFISSLKPIPVNANSLSSCSRALQILLGQ